jgi:uncharacterized protein (DUF1499 family)
MGVNKNQLKRVAASAGMIGTAVGAAWFLRNWRLFSVNDVTTGDCPQYPDLRAHVYFASTADVAEAVHGAIADLANWRFVASSETQVFAEVESAFGSFLSDVTVTLQPLGPRHIRAVINSRSRQGCGVGDLGENARFIRQLQTEMDTRLTGG